MANVAQTTPRAEAPVAPAPARLAHALSPIEVEVIDLFVEFSRLLGLPKSVAEIYGLLFISPRPVPMDELIRRLNLSKGSASQGLRFLRTLVAAKRVYVPGDRRDHYEAETELRKLAGGFLKEQVGPHLDAGLLRIAQLERMTRALLDAEREQVARRLEKLRNWERAGKRALPWITRILQLRA